MTFGFLGRATRFSDGSGQKAPRLPRIAADGRYVISLCHMGYFARLARSKGRRSNLDIGIADVRLRLSGSEGPLNLGAVETADSASAPPIMEGLTRTGPR